MIFQNFVRAFLKAAGHRYYKRVPYMTPKGKRYRYFYRVTSTHRGRHAFDEAHLVEGTKFALHGEGESEFHGHITKVDGDQVTYVIDDGPRKGEEVTTTRAKLVAELNDVHGVQDKLTAEREKVRATIAEAKRAGHGGVVRRLERRLRALGGEPEAQPAEPTEPEAEPKQTIRDAVAKLRDALTSGDASAEDARSELVQHVRDLLSELGGDGALEDGLRGLVAHKTNKRALLRDLKDIERRLDKIDEARAPKPVDAEPDFESTLLQEMPPLEEPEPARPRGSDSWVSERAKDTHEKIKRLVDDEELFNDFYEYVYDNADDVNIADDMRADYEQGNFSRYALGDPSKPHLGGAAISAAKLGRAKKIKKGKASDFSFGETEPKGFRLAWIDEGKGGKKGIGVYLTEGTFKGNHVILQGADRKRALSDMAGMMRRLDEVGLLSDNPDAPFDFLADATDPRGFNVLNRQLSVIAELSGGRNVSEEELEDQALTEETRAKLVDEYGETVTAEIESRMRRLTDETREASLDADTGRRYADAVEDHFDKFLEANKAREAEREEQDRRDQELQEELERERQEQREQAEREEQERLSREAEERQRRREEREARRAEEEAKLSDDDRAKLREERERAAREAERERQGFLALDDHDEARDAHYEYNVKNASSALERREELQGIDPREITKSIKEPMPTDGERKQYTLPDGVTIDARMTGDALIYQYLYPDGDVSETQRVELNRKRKMTDARARKLMQGVAAARFAGNGAIYTPSTEDQLEMLRSGLADVARLNKAERDFNTFSEKTQETRVQRDALDPITPRSDAINSAEDIDKKTLAALKRARSTDSLRSNITQAGRDGDLLFATDGHRIFYRRGMNFGEDNRPVAIDNKATPEILSERVPPANSLISGVDAKVYHAGTISKETAKHLVDVLKIAEGTKTSTNVVIRAEGDTLTFIHKGRELATIPRAFDGSTGDFVISADYFRDALRDGGAVSVNLPSTNRNMRGDAFEYTTPLRFDSMIGSHIVMPKKMR